MKKKWLVVSLAFLAVLGCEKVGPVETPEEKPAATGTHVASLTFGVEQDGTRGIFVNDQTFQWSAGDQIGVYLYSSTLENVAGAYNMPGKYGPWIAPFDLKSGAGTGSGLFSRELSYDLGETYGNVAIYPYTEGSSFTYAQGGGTLSFNLPACYTDLDNLDMVRMPMVAKLDMEPGEDKTHFEFKHVGGAVKVTLLNVPAEAKYFKLWTTEGGNISGTFTIDLNNVGSGTLQGNGSGNTVELQLKEGRAAASVDVYFPVPAGTYTFGVGVYGDGVTFLEKQGTSGNTIGRGNILRMPALTIPSPLGPYADYQSPAEKTAGIIYQVNVYSFADSDGDGIGDFKGIENHLDYLDKLGVTALWLSPSQVAQSYHGYDISDYTALNPAYGSGTHTSAQAEADFQSLINKAHAHNIRIYMDYVINHTGDQHPWFQDVKRNGPSSTYWNYYAMSQAPWNDVPAGNIAQIPYGSTYKSGEWFPALTGAGLSVKRYAIDLDWTNASAPTFTVSETSEAVTSGGSHDNPARYLFWGNGTYTQFADNGTNKYRLVLDYQSDWGCLVRTTNGDDWSSGTKWGFNAMEQVALNTAHTLYSGASDDVKNILMPDGTLYYYYSAFYTGMMPDINYGWASDCEHSPAFGAIVATLDKWLNMGLDGLRLDAVKHVYNNTSDNVSFWQKFYDVVNTKYAQYASKRSNLVGTADQNIFMVGEVLDGESTCRPYYGGLPAIFEFQFWWDLRDALNNGQKGNFVSGLCERYYRHQEERKEAIGREDAIPTPKLTNHDEDRAASVLYERHRIRQAAAVLLTAPGRPIVYQGEELGYWGTGTNGDEYRRAPILWTSSISSAATHGVNDKYDANMLTASISVEAQAADDASLLTLYRRFAYARNTNPALADGHPEYDNKTGENSVIMGWYMHANDNSGKTCLVLHNISGSTQTVQRWDGDNVSSDNILVASDPVSVSTENGKWVTMPPYSSVVFALN